MLSTGDQSTGDESTTEIAATTTFPQKNLDVTQL
jgi:hypothetical protein